jgi:hypothetical protein
MKIQILDAYIFIDFGAVLILAAWVANGLVEQAKNVLFRF